MGLGGEASHLRHEVERNQKDPDNGKITLIVLIIIAIMTLICVAGCISKDAEQQRAIDAAEQTEETSTTVETTEETTEENRTEVQAEEPLEEYNDGASSDYPPPPYGNGAYTDYPSEEEIFGYPSQGNWQDDYLDDAYKAYGEQQEYDDRNGAPY